METTITTEACNLKAGDRIIHPGYRSTRIQKLPEWEVTVAAVKKCSDTVVEVHYKERNGIGCHILTLAADEPMRLA